MTKPLPGDGRRILVHPPALLSAEEHSRDPAPLPPELSHASAGDAPGSVVSTSLAGAVEAFERSLIQDALRTTRGNRSRAARLLGTTERVISYKVRKYRIDPERLRD